MARVRPGVDETLAAFSPTSAFSRLDLPTLERPRKAISGTVGAGNCAAERAESRNWAVSSIAGLPGSVYVPDLDLPFRIVVAWETGLNRAIEREDRCNRRYFWRKDIAPASIQG